MKSIIIILTIFSTFQLSAQTKDYGVSDKYPFGQPNPNAPENIIDFEPMIGICDCKSVQRNKDGTWQDTLNMIWRFKYILNGTAIQDETWHESGFFATSIRQINTDSLNWVVSYFGTKIVTNTVNVWTGKKEGNQIVLKMPQKSPGGLDGFSRLTFYNMTENGFKWKGEWVDIKETVVYPFWTIDCTKRK